MIDTSLLRANTDLLTLISRDTSLRRIASTKGGEWQAGCPFCGGTKRLKVQPYAPDGGRWFCRHCTNGEWRDAISYVMQRENCDFRSACDLLGSDELLPARTRISKPQPQRRSSSPQAAWQARARALILECESAIWRKAGTRAREWLHARGLADVTVRRWHLGYNPSDRFEPLSAWGVPDPHDGKRHAVYLPHGVVVPCEVNGVIWYLKIRRLPGLAFRCGGCKQIISDPSQCPHCEADNRYRNVEGGAAALFGAENLQGHDVAIVCEGEFDAMLLGQEAGDLVGVATPGSASGRLDLSIWGRYLLPISRFLLALDSDPAGARGKHALASLSARMRIVRVPQLGPKDKDVTDYFRAGGRLRDWVEFELTRSTSAKPRMGSRAFLH